MPGRTKHIVAVVALALAAACGDPATSPVAPAAAARPSASAVKRWDTNAAADWTDRANDLAARSLAAGRPANVARLYAYLGLAQLRAAEDAGTVRPHPPTSSAIAAASAAVLTSYFAPFAAEIAADLAADLAAERWPGAKHQDAAVGTAVGRAAARRVLDYSAGDGFGLTDPGQPPVGPGYWRANGGPIVRGSLGARPFYLASGDEMRPAPPPAFGSPAFAAALDAVRQISLARTPEQVASARYWNVNQSGAADVVMNALAAELVRTHRSGDLESARVFFLMNSAAFDALVGCFDAKYHYWFVRPPQADPTLGTVFAAPPHPSYPSYPSAHSCVSGSSTGVLAALFPRERDRVTALAEEAGLSRIYAGIHYPFDNQAGLALGRAAAAKALAADLDAVAVR